MNRTKIEWCDYTINPVKGLCPMACSYCYARAMYKRFKWNPEIRYERPLMYIEPFNIKTPSRIFVGSTIELFGDWIKREWLEHIFEMVRYYKQHTFIFLTKQPQNLPKWSPFPENCWVGITAIDATMFYDGMAELNKIKATVKFVSFEPLLDQINGGECEAERLDLLEFVGISWVIIGQKKPVSTKTRPKSEWIGEIIESSDKAGIPVFIKDNILQDKGLHWQDQQNWNRQEFPRG